MRDRELRLQSILNYKRLIEEGLRREMARIQDQLGRAEERLEALQTQKKKAVRELAEHQRTELILQEMMLYHYFLNQIGSEIERQKDLLIEMRQRLEERRKELIQASQEKRMLEILKEKRDRVRHQEQLKVERRFMDEMASRRHHQGQGGDSPER
jgi:flagellar FliJ protein